jgi:hypothetical protein
MYERWTRLTTADSGDLGYRHAARPIAAIVVLVLGVLCLCGAYWKLTTEWPESWQSAAIGLLFGFVFFMTAQQWATVRETWFTRTPPTVKFVRNLLGWKRVRLQELGTSGIVSCERRSDPDQSDATLSYQVFLTSSESPASPVFIHSYYEHDEPAEIAGEIANCLGWAFEDRSLANPGQTPSVTSYLRSRIGFASVVRAGVSLSTVATTVTAIGMFSQAMIYFAGLCEGAMVIGWAIALIAFLAMRVVFRVTHRRLHRTAEEAGA